MLDQKIERNERSNYMTGQLKYLLAYFVLKRQMKVFVLNKEATERRITRFKASAKIQKCWRRYKERVYSIRAIPKGTTKKSDLSSDQIKCMTRDSRLALTGTAMYQHQNAIRVAK